METQTKIHEKHIGKQQCTNCKCWRLPDNYIVKTDPRKVSRQQKDKIMKKNIYNIMLI
jgi:hypothetical protein